ncbi:MAG: cobalamin-dependent protein [Thermodesulfovibrionales bacterium]|nr:cobalamin-dependent protein [Thermodesulfovibrionales bacterium]
MQETNANIEESTFKKYMSYLLQGDRHTCHDILKECLDKGTDIKTIYLDLFQRSLYEIGRLWEYNRISVAVEHVATSITEGLMSVLYPLIFSYEKINKSAVISCTANEFHQIGGRMVADIFEINAWNGFFLGANTPMNDLLRYIEEKKPQIVGLSLSIYLNLPNLLKILETINAHYPSQKIIVGGQAFRYGGVDALKKYQNVNYIDSIDELERRIKHEW